MLMLFPFFSALNIGVIISNSSMRVMAFILSFSVKYVRMRLFLLTETPEKDTQGQRKEA
jgi:hypothetical protein